MVEELRQQHMVGLKGASPLLNRSAARSRVSNTTRYALHVPKPRGTNHANVYPTPVTDELIYHVPRAVR